MLLKVILDKIKHLKKYNFLYCVYLESYYENFGYLLKCHFLDDIESFLINVDGSSINIPEMSKVEELSQQFDIVEKYFLFLEKQNLTPSSYFKQIGFNSKESSILTKRVLKMKEIISKGRQKWSTIR
jgi:hypothetical protein